MVKVLSPRSAGHLGKFRKRTTWVASSHERIFLFRSFIDQTSRVSQSASHATWSIRRHTFLQDKTDTLHGDYSFKYSISLYAWFAQSSTPVNNMHCTVFWIYTRILSTKPKGHVHYVNILMSFYDNFLLMPIPCGASINTITIYRLTWHELIGNHRTPQLKCGERGVGGRWERGD